MILELEIDPDIDIREDMPEDIKVRLKVTLTMGAKKYNCHWTELTWSVKDGIIRVKHE